MNETYIVVYEYYLEYTQFEGKWEMCCKEFDNKDEAMALYTSMVANINAQEVKIARLIDKTILK